MSAEITRVLGSGHYDARWVARSNLVRLTATGILPCQNQVAQLELRPERVVPPMWNLVFFVEDFCERALKPFSHSVVMVNTTGADAILVHDAAGLHEVKIRQAYEPQLGDSEDCVVYARLPKPDRGHVGCFVATADTLASALHYCAFGPAPRDACEAFVAGQEVSHDPAWSAPDEPGPWPLVS